MGLKKFGDKQNGTAIKGHYNEILLYVTDFSKKLLSTHFAITIHIHKHVCINEEGSFQGHILLFIDIIFIDLYKTNSILNHCLDLNLCLLCRYKIYIFYVKL